MEIRHLKYMQIKKILSNKWLLVIAFLLAVILRVWHLGSIPPGLTPDEASLGYNAYSILHTGRDEYGKFLPIIFKSFGDFKPGLYVYLAVPEIAVFGLSEFSTRLPSVIAGIFSVFLIYLIVKKLFRDNDNLPVIAAFVAALNPYLIYFSRGAWEANVSLALTLAGIYLFLWAMEKNKYLIFSFFSFALTLITYQGAKLSTLIVLVLLITIYWKEFWKIGKQYLFVSTLIGIIISAPIILSFFNGQTQRLAIFSVFSYPRPASEIQSYSDGYFELFHSNQLNYFRMVMTRWFNFYSGKFLIFEGDLENPVHTSPYQGVLLFADLFMLPLGLFAIFKNKISKGSLFITLWLILAPFSAAISRDQTNAVRSLNAAIPMVVVISLGLFFFFTWVSKQKYTVLYNITLSALYLFSLIYFLDAYFIHLPAHNSNFWRYGYRESVSYIAGIQSKYKNIVFEQSFNQPYIYFLFYGAKTNPEKYNPSKYQNQVNLIDSQYKGDVGFETGLDNIQFKQMDWSVLKNAHGTLVVAGPASIPPEILNNSKDFPIVDEIRYLNGRDTAFYMIEIK
ncbi:MAG TPA: glycosyltransferase family 39 protein [Patescibacteria group bacterium]|nr:glycosyltransferase family 39 protein [Patescibacteria group bacterium]